MKKIEKSTNWVLEFQRQDWDGMSNVCCVFRGCKRLADFSEGTFVDECMPAMGEVGLSHRSRTATARPPAPCGEKGNT